MIVRRKGTQGHMCPISFLNDLAILINIKGVLFDADASVADLFYSMRTLAFFSMRTFRRRFVPSDADVLAGVGLSQIWAFKYDNGLFRVR